MLNKWVGSTFLTKPHCQLMKNKRLFLRLLVSVSLTFIAAYPSSSEAQGFLKTSGTRIVDERGRMCCCAVSGLADGCCRKVICSASMRTGNNTRSVSASKSWQEKKRPMPSTMPGSAIILLRKDIEALKSLGLQQCAPPHAFQSLHIAC